MGEETGEQLRAVTLLEDSARLAESARGKTAVRGFLHFKHFTACRVLYCTVQTRLSNGTSCLF